MSDCPQHSNSIDLVERVLCGLYYCDEDQLKDYHRRENGWSGDQGDIDNQNDNGGKEG